MIVRCEIKLQAKTLLTSNVEESAALLKNEMISEMLEFAYNKIVATSASDTFIIHDSKVVQIIRRPDALKTTPMANTFRLATVPEFDVVKFPFVISATGSGYNIINVSSASVSPLLKSADDPSTAQMGTFFSETQGSDCRLNFATAKSSVAGKT